MIGKDLQDMFDRNYAEAMKSTMVSLDTTADKFRELMTIINRHDPVRLLDIGVPEDESTACPKAVGKIHL